MGVPAAYRWSVYDHEPFKAVSMCSSRSHRLRPNRLNAPQASFSPVYSQKESSSNKKRNQLLFKLVSALFSIEPIWILAKSKAKQKIADRGDSIGFNQAAAVEQLRFAVPDWDVILRDTADPELEYPDYYFRAFHAYDQGNLSWQAAFEVPSAAKLVHLAVMDPENRNMRADGEQQMRESYSTKMLSKIRQVQGGAIENIVDLGCATGLSSIELQRIFPHASITGIDLSPHFLSVGKVMQAQSQVQSKIKFVHGLAEKTCLDTGKTDLVSVCLLLHELPQHRAYTVLKEAFRILRPGGFLCIMEMDPSSERFRRMALNPFAFVPFSATEPWLEEYCALDLKQLLGNIGFESVSQEPSTPGHFTLVCQKPS